MDSDQTWALGQNIARRRKQAGLSQTALGERLNPKVTRRTVSRWEQGECYPERKHLIALALLFGCDPADLFEQNPAA